MSRGLGTVYITSVELGIQSSDDFTFCHERGDIDAWRKGPELRNPGTITVAQFAPSGTITRRGSERQRRGISRAVRVSRKFFPAADAERIAVIEIAERFVVMKLRVT